jgi:outer membrane lipoprotein-sorting protein
LKRAAATALAGLALLALVAPAHAKSDAKKKKDAAASEQASATSWFAQLVTHGDTGVRVDHLWSKGRKLRSEMVVQGRPILTLVSGEFYRIIDVVAQQGVSIRRSPEALAADRKQAAERPFATEGREIMKAGEFVRSENHGGRPCRVFRQTNERGKREVWVTDDKKQLPLRVEFFARESGVRTTTDYIDWISELPLPDTFFEPDPRIPLETVEYADYLKRSAQGPVGPAPVLFAPLLHGK